MKHRYCENEFRGTYPKEKIKRFYSSIVNKIENPNFDDWLIDMNKSGIFIVEDEKDKLNVVIKTCYSIEKFEIPEWDKEQAKDFYGNKFQCLETYARHYLIGELCFPDEFEIIYLTNTDFKTVFEICPSCDNEVEIPNERISKCPVCGKEIIPCAMCYDCISPCVWNIINKKRIFD